jgi:hypothetical protein
MRFNLDLKTEAAYQTREFKCTKNFLCTCQKMLEIDTRVHKKDGLPTESNDSADGKLKF